MPWFTGCPSDPVPPKGSLDPIAVTLHRTIGQWPGDYSVGKNEGLFQFLIGQDDGQWVQFMDTNSVAYHCNGSNFKSFGIELSGQNGEPLTAWQIARLGDILRWANTVHGIPLVYQDPAVTPAASIHVNDGNFRGVISHVSVQTDDGSSQHVDYVPLGEFQTAVAGPTPPPFPNQKEGTVVSCCVAPDGTVYAFVVGEDDSVYANHKPPAGEWTGWGTLGGKVRK